MAAREVKPSLEDLEMSLMHRMETGKVDEKDFVQTFDSILADKSNAINPKNYVHGLKRDKRHNLEFIGILLKRVGRIQKHINMIENLSGGSDND